MPDLPIFKTTLMEENERLKKENAELKSKLISMERRKDKLMDKLENALESKTQQDKEVAVKAIESLKLSPKAKAGCIGEFSVEHQDVCPECWSKGHNRDCEICHGECDDDGYIYSAKDIPWTTQKDIFKAMLSHSKEYALEQLQEQN